MDTQDFLCNVTGYIAISYKKKPTNAHLYYSHHFISTVLLQRVSALGVAQC